LAIFHEGDHGRGGPRALGVLDHLRLLAVHDGDARVRGAKVDADDLAHVVTSSLLVGGRCGEAFSSEAPLWCRVPGSICLCRRFRTGTPASHADMGEIAGPARAKAPDHDKGIRLIPSTRIPQSRSSSRRLRAALL